MFCENCGQQVPEGSGFCPSCGAPVQMSPAVQSPEEKPAVKNGPEELRGQKVTENVYFCPDGKYRWVYEFHMLHNPVLLITVMKVLCLSFGIVLAFMAVLQLFEDGIGSFADSWGFYGGFLILLAVICGIGVIAYLILSAVYGWKYVVIFTMDEAGIEHRQMPRQLEKAQALGWLTALAGLAAGSLSTAGAGMLAASRSTSYSEFGSVKKVKAARLFQVIYVNQLLAHNQVYAEPEDFDFVWNFIVQHCPTAKIRGCIRPAYSGR